MVRGGRATKIIKEHELLEAAVALVSNPFLIYDMFMIEGLAQPKDETQWRENISQRILRLKEDDGFKFLFQGFCHNIICNKLREYA